MTDIRMPAPSPLPQYVYKILSEALPDPLPSSLPMSALDANDGFIHLSTAEQIPATASRFYAHTNSLFLMKIPLDRIKESTKWEEAGSGCFPHLYGAELGREEVVDVKEFRREVPEPWTNVLSNDAWLQ